MMRCKVGMSVFLLILISLSGCISKPAELPKASVLPVVQTFQASPAIIKAGEYSTLSWVVTGASKVYIDNNIGSVALTGNIPISPVSTTYYTLTASNSSDNTTAVAQIIVNTPSGYQAAQERVIVLPVIRQESGSLVKNNAMYTVQETVCAGDTGPNLASRAFLSFDISGIPPNATISEATLDLSNYSQIGNPTYTGTSMVQGASMVSGLGALEVYFYPYGGLSNLGIMAYNRPATLVSGGNILNYPLSPWHLDVKSSDAGDPVVQNLVQTGQTRCQFRIQFFTSTNWDMKADMLCFDDAKLIIKYTMP